MEIFTSTQNTGTVDRGLAGGTPTAIALFGNQIINTDKKLFLVEKTNWFVESNASCIVLVSCALDFYNIDTLLSDDRITMEVWIEQYKYGSSWEIITPKMRSNFIADVKGDSPSSIAIPMKAIMFAKGDRLRVMAQKVSGGTALIGIETSNSYFQMVKVD